MPTAAPSSPADRSTIQDGVSIPQWGLALLIGSALALLKWSALLDQSGLVGGDTWPYFFPQKQVLAESLQQQQTPLWHDLSGLGYPLLAESQAGVYYPSNQLLYRLLPAHRAYYASIVLHYALAFVFAWRFARTQNLSQLAALLAALVFVYGWFPARISLEWSIIGGVWLPLTLWITDSLLRNPTAGRVALLASCLGVHLLAGHFTLAFINQLTLLLYALLQWWLHLRHRPSAWKRGLLVPLAVAAGFCVAAVQLVPSMELKQISQREDVESDRTSRPFDPGYGHMPPLYLSQLFTGWTWWHTPEVRYSGAMQRLPGSIDSATNAVEAHFYLGLLPLAFAALGLFSRDPSTRIPRLSWMLLGVAGIVYATGWLLPLTRWLPGFTYFMGPGRYTIVSTLAGAVLCGLGIDRFFPRGSLRFVGVLLIGCLTWFDLAWSAAPIADAQVVPEIWSHRDESWIRRYFAAQPARHSRLAVSGPNVGNLFGVSCVPQYLGIGPAVYFSDLFDLTTSPADPEFLSAEQLKRMQALGVTHVLTTEALTRPIEELNPVGAGPDALLNRIWGRGAQPCYLFALKHPGSRVTSDPPNAISQWSAEGSSSNAVQLQITLQEEATVHLKELMLPGWEVTVDGSPASPVTETALTRSVAVPLGEHVIEWRYQSRWHRMGGVITIISLISLWTAPLVLRRRKP